MTKSPVQRKVYAATIGGGSSAVVATFVIWVTGLCFGGSADSQAVMDTIAAVPGPVSGLELLLISALSPFLAGYFAKGDESINA